jgi:hypothetical protein
MSQKKNDLLKDLKKSYICKIKKIIRGKKEKKKRKKVFSKLNDKVHLFPQITTKKRNQQKEKE